MQLWDQQEGESAAAYARFLLFRNLGPARTVPRAAQLAIDQLAVADAPKPKRKKPNKTEQKAAKQSLPIRGWYSDSSAWNWQSRAEAWDVWRLLDSGNRVQAGLTELLMKLTNAGIDAVDNKDWKDALTIFRELVNHAPNKLIAAAQVDAPADPPAGPRLHAPDRGAV